MSDPLMAEIKLFAGNFAPRGWAFCEGQLLPIAQYSALFSLLGTIYGGDGRTTFALPDLRGRTPIGPGNGPGLSSRREGQKGGTEYVVLNQTQIPSHSHPYGLNDVPVQISNISSTAELKVSSGSGEESSPSNGEYIGAPKVGSGGNVNLYTETAPDTTLGAGSIAVTTTGSGTITTPSQNTFNAGGNQSHTNMQPWIAIYYIIAMIGIFPSRS